MSESKLKTYRYTFKFKDGRSKIFEVILDYASLNLIQEPKDSYPAWTELEFNQCPNCPLSAAQHKHCPVAQNLAELIDFFRDFLSYEEVDVTVESASRDYVCHTSLQHGISSLMGIIMATSGCPVLDKLRPMVDTHLPFPTPDETTYRIVGMYLIAQYFLYKRGKPADWDMKKLLEFLSEISKINSAFCKRLNSIEIKDATINAVVNLNFLSAFTGLSLEKDRLDRLKNIFDKAYGQN